MLNLAQYHCRLNNESLVKIEEPMVNVYVRLSNVCNADCNFCEFCGEKKRFDKAKFKELFIRLHKQIRINKVSFTGGEPTLDFSLFEEMVDFVKSIDDKIFTVVNTNGIYLSKLANLKLNSVALSRHHYLDEVNDSIFKTRTPTSEEIKSYGANNLHLSCNLIKGYVGSTDEIFKYLDWCSRCSVKDVGFVGLMKVNQFCEEHFVDYDVLDIKNTIRTKNWSRSVNGKTTCKCANFVYAGKSLVNFYCRHYVCNNNESVVVYDLDTFKNGFNGECLDDQIGGEMTWLIN